MRLPALNYVRHVVRSLEVAMSSGQEGKRRQRVLTTQLVRGTPFYGFHPGERLFIKLNMCVPRGRVRTC